MRNLKGRFGKKTAILAGAMVLTMALGVSAYAGTVADKNVGEKDTGTIKATMLTQAQTVPEGEENKDFVELTKIVLNEDGEKGESVKAVMCTPSMEATELTEEEAAEFKKLSEIEIEKADKDVVDAVKITVKATPAEKK